MNQSLQLSHHSAQLLLKKSEEISDILKECPFKTSTLDQLPASLLRSSRDILLPILTKIVNCSLSPGEIEGAKLAHLTPLLKDPKLDQSVLKNYRPISNLTFIGKLIERVVLRRLNEHLQKNNLNIPLQSG